MASFELIEPPLLSRAEIDRADQVRKDPERLAAGWAQARILLVDHSGRYAVTDTGGLRWTPAAELGAAPVVGAVFLGVAEVDRWALRVDEVPAPSGEPRSGAHLLGPDEAGLLATALGVLNWHRTAQFSPVDGRPLDLVQGGWLRRDPESGAEEYPRTDPAVIMVVHDGADRVLLGRQSVWPDRWFSTLAGFVEPGESLEQCVRREVFEEAGVHVHSPRYLGSQPWPFPRSLMLGFEAVGDPSEPLVFRDGELGDAKWFHRDEVREALAREDDWGADNPGTRLMLPGSVSIARSLIDGWARGPQA
ncbi:NAD(+) diphosphatase [Gordonia neofelifaecis]|uniref:NAD(+) diphosphatase n=1 Tax=Gordonia neofelifaecis NRRL B-59395 TaxID=644548 RepID=F1YJL5_9ACTN|nr:NAD(+) diphosphatase [Gordonia neofelifaecis]EGD55248.1 NADH pyrophosphatase [Gordonia neofelifaecis NRRL B-59395]